MVSFELERFVTAQDPVYSRVLAELRGGEKRSHWMWFIFPQIAGLGSSPTAQRFAIHSLAEARAYVTHPVLGVRLVECTALVQQIQNRSIHDIFGSPDDLKFRSSMTLFAHATPEQALFQHALDKYFKGEADSRTDALIAPGEK